MVSEQIYNKSNTQWRYRSGVTLIEVMVATALTGILVTAVCSVYFYSLQAWERSRAAGAAYTTTVLGIRRLEERLEKAVRCTVYSNPTGDELILYFPSQTDSKGEYVPIWTANPTSGKTYLRYTPYGSNPYSEIYYLSDKSGIRAKPGNILWRGKYTTGVGWVPDSEWSLIPGTNPPQGRVAPIKAISFSYTQNVTYSGYSSVYAVWITITAEQKYRGQTSLISISRRVKLRNYE